MSGSAVLLVVTASVVVVAGVEVFDLIKSDVALAAFTDLVSWPSSTRKQQVTAAEGGSRRQREH